MGNGAATGGIGELDRSWFLSAAAGDGPPASANSSTTRQRLSGVHFTRILLEPLVKVSDYFIADCNGYTIRTTHNNVNTH